jgi:hypothetical protein
VAVVSGVAMRRTFYARNFPGRPGAVQRPNVRRAAAHGCHGFAQQGNVVVTFERAGDYSNGTHRSRPRLQRALATTEVKAHFQALNTSVLPLSSKEVDARIRADTPRWQELMKKAGIEPQ